MPSLIEAIQQKDLSLVEQALVSDPNAVKNQILCHQIPLHKALETGNAAIVKLILARLELYPKEFAEIILALDHKGHGILYLAAMYCDFEIFSLVVKLLNEHVFKQAKLLTHDLCLPVDMVGFNPHKEDQQKIREFLEEITIDKKCKPLNQAIDFNALAIKLDDKLFENSALITNLRYACFAASYARKIILRSSTHPSCNALDQTLVQSWVDECIAMRKNYAEENKKIVSTDQNTKNLAKLQNIVKKVREQQLGNCFEFSCVVLDTLLKMGCKTRAEIFQIKHGDHFFVVIDKAPSSGDYAWRTWGPNAVIVDAWKGKVYPASKLLKKLTAYSTYRYKNKRACVTYPFHKKYHELAACSDLKLNWDFFAKDHADLSQFSQAEIQEIQRLTMQEPLLRNVVGNPYQLFAENKAPLTQMPMEIENDSQLNKAFSSKN